MDDTRRQMRILVRWLPLLLATAILTGLSAFYWASSQPTVYQASSTLTVGAGLDPSLDDLLVAQQMAGTYAGLVSTRDLLGPVITRLGLNDTVDELRSRVSAIANPGTAIITVNARDRDADQAALIANTVADELMSNIAGTTDSAYRAGVDSYLQAIQKEIEQTQAQADALLALTAPTPVQLAELDGAQERLRTLQTSYADLLPYSAAYARNSLTIQEPAVTPGSAVEPRPLFWTLLAALVGLMIGAVIVFIAEFTKEPAKDPQSILAATGVPILGSVTSPRRARPDAAGLASAFEQRTPVSATYVNLRLSLDAVSGRIGSLLVTSVSPSRGKSNTAVCLAIEYARSGRQVVLIDADLKDPTLDLYFGLPNSVGLVTLLGREDPAWTTVAQPTPLPGLRVITTGSPQVYPARGMGSQRLQVVLSQMRSDTDMIIINGPVLPLGAERELAPSVQATLLVVERTGTSARSLREACDALDAIGANLIGTVLHERERVDNVTAISDVRDVA